VQAASGPKPAASGIVLIVDDEEPGRKVAGAVLQHLGFAVLAAPDGATALELLRQHPGAIACVLCDLTMPCMDGWETLAALRQVQPGLPVILTSGYAESSVMKGEHPEAPSVFLSKPYSLARLQAALGQALGGRQAGGRDAP